VHCERIVGHVIDARLSVNPLSLTITNLPLSHLRTLPSGTSDAVHRVTTNLRTISNFRTGISLHSLTDVTLGSIPVGLTQKITLDLHNPRSRPFHLRPSTSPSHEPCHPPLRWATWWSCVRHTLEIRFSDAGVNSGITKDRLPFVESPSLPSPSIVTVRRRRPKRGRE
jgi:hypothetical protein